MSKQFIILNLFVATIFLVSACGNTHTEEQNSNVNEEVQTTPPFTEDKTQVALTFLNSYVENCNLMSESIGVIDWVNTSDLVSTNFKNELQKTMDEAYASDPEMGLGADPLFDAQDWPEEGFELDTINEETNEITLKGINWPDFKVIMNVIEENGKWLVDGCGMVNIADQKKAVE